jgi:CubicO group peptidase (beta-lactamase class C family)
MRRPLVILTLAILLSLGTHGYAADDLLLSRFGDYLESLRSQAGIPGLSAILVGPTDVMWSRAFGQQDLERLLATRTDTPFELDGLTQLATDAIILRCAESGTISIDDLIGKYTPDSPYAGATVRQVMSHTSGTPDNLTFSYSPERLASLAGAVTACTDESFPASIAGLLDRLVMMTDSVPGSDIVTQSPPDPSILPSTIARYASALTRLARPYAINGSGQATVSHYTATTLTPASGLISSALDLAQLDLGLKSGYLLRPEWEALAWTPPLDRNGQRLPAGLGWFVQTYNGETVAWQFGVADGASSSMMINVPGRGITLILLANSSGLVRPFSLAAGDVTVSPFGRLFLGIFVR